jgi:hypothetical protein
MASPHSFHERADPVSDTVGVNFCAPRSASRAPPIAPRAYAFCPLAVSLDSMVNIAS